MSECPSCEDVFDSERARNIHHSIVHDESLVVETTSCIECGEEFDYYPSCKPGKYCSGCVDDGFWRGNVDNLNFGLTGEDNPNYSGGKIVNCSNCGDETKANPSCIERKENIFCSNSCYREFRSESYKGEGNPNWKGGYNPNYSSGWWKVRRQALNRDNNICQNCGETENFNGMNMDVHHITPVREFEDPSDAHMLENVICLCRSCHAKADSGKIYI